VLANEDLKSTLKVGGSKINSKNLLEFINEFESVVVNLAKETFTSSNNINKGQGELNHSPVKEIVPYRSTSKKDFNYQKKRFSVSEKKLEFFNRKLRETIDGKNKNKSNFNSFRTEDEGLRATTVNNCRRPSNIQRKLSMHRMREKLKEEVVNKQEKKFEKATQGFDYLQGVSYGLKIEKSSRKDSASKSKFLLDESYLRKRQGAKSCGKKNIKMLTELMRNLQENINHTNKNSKNSEKKTQFNFKSLTRNNTTREHFDKRYTNNRRKKEEFPYLQTSKIESSESESTKSMKLQDNSPENNPNSATTLRSISYASSIESKRLFRVNSTEENIHEKEFKINVYRCSYSSLADYDRELDYFYGSSGYTPKSIKDFNISLKNCRRSRDEYESNSRKMSEITPPSSVNDD
jgi:hypothetical protein